MALPWHSDASRNPKHDMTDPFHLPFLTPPPRPAPLRIPFPLSAPLHPRSKHGTADRVVEVRIMASAVKNKPHSEIDRWICIYPAYLNSKKTLAEGRKIAKDKAVENPTHQEIRDVLIAAGMKVGVENKLYSRERSKELLFRGRIRVQLKNDDGTPFNSSFPTRDSLLLHLGEMIPKLKARVNRPSGSEQSQQQSSTGGKKKGKKR
ncbi:signal recognition particle 19 kDa protein [Thrips palmi]|uniref:Signal recognition particle 19 kDa protein n=1 Tax=Thrips palmi TaxID=161013 RepID=A0A6P8ZDQ7_THRPL|nr:signal recognition particle 19 kDa protein [Thrips palmi]